MKSDKRGVADLPIKLVVIMVILSVSVPIVMQAADDSQRSMMGDEMGQEVERIKDAAAVVYYSGTGSSRTLDIELPEGCEISIGGEGPDSYSIRSSYNGETISVTYFEKPAISVEERIVLNGYCNLMIANNGDNRVGFSVQ